MDSLLDSLIPLKKKKKRTTYQRVTTTDTESNETTNLSGTGFLFDNSTIDKIKNRLNDDNDDASEEVLKNKEDEIQNDSSNFQTQVISDLYDGGEDLEETIEKTQMIQKQTATINSNLFEMQSSTDVAATQIITQAVSDTIESSNINLQPTQLINQDMPNMDESNGAATQISSAMDMQQTQIIGKSVQTFSSEADKHIHETETQIIEPKANEATYEAATQIIATRKSNNESDDTQVTQKLTNDSNINILNFAQHFDKSLFGDMDRPEKTQVISNDIPESTTNTQTQVISNTEKFATNDTTQIIPKTFETETVSRSILKTQKDQLGSDSENDDDYANVTVKIKATNFDKTQADTDLLNTQPVTNNDTQIDQTTSETAAELERRVLGQLPKEQEEAVKHGLLKEYKIPTKKLVSKLKFSKDDFLADFDDSDTDEEDEQEKKPIDKPIVTESHTLEEQFERELDEFDRSNISKNFSKEEINDQEEEEQSFINKEMRNSDNKPPLHITGLINYETELRKEIHSEQYINLDDDSSDSDSMNARLSHASKASLLNIRVRLSKNATHTKKLKQNKSTPSKLFSTLMQANQKQIQEHHKEIIEAKGLDASLIEKEKDIVENLLEQEILRNQKIRKREKERENLEKVEADMDFDYSDNELAGSDVTDEELEANNDTNNDKQANDGFDTNLSSEDNTEGDRAVNDIDTIKNGDDDEDDITKKGNKRTKSFHITNVEDSDDEEKEEHTENKQSIEEEDSISYARNAIDLGHYGSNLDKQHTQDNKLPSAASKTIPTDIFENEEEDEEDDEMEARIEFINKEKKKQLEHEKKVQKGKAEMKKMGVSNFVEEEAEESDDEWFGVGGVDGDGADEYDSEVEKMIDDYSKANFNPDEIRQMIAQEKKHTDLKMVEKILYDLKNGGLRKRGRSTYDLELSDDEDDDLRQYRIKRREMMKQRRLDLGVDKLVQNPKSKAFFESMVEDIIDTKNPFGDTEVNNDTQSTTTGGDTQEIPEKESSESPDVESKTNTVSKKFTLSEDFVHRSLSFLSETNKDVAEIENDKMLARIQHGRDIEDLSTLKKQSSIKSFKSIHSSQGTVDLDNDDNETDQDRNGKPGFRDDDSDISRFRHPSILKLFGSKNDINDKFKEGSKSVKVVNSYKSVGSNKASITYLGKTRKLMPPKKRKRGFLIGSGRTSKLNQLFDSHTNSFE